MLMAAGEFFHDRRAVEGDFVQMFAEQWLEARQAPAGDGDGQRAEDGG